MNEDAARDEEADDHDGLGKYELYDVHVYVLFLLVFLLNTISILAQALLFVNSMVQIWGYFVEITVLVTMEIKHKRKGCMMEKSVAAVRGTSLVMAGLLALFVGTGVIAVVFDVLTWEMLGDWTLKAVLVCVVIVVMSAIVGLISPAPNSKK